MALLNFENIDSTDITTTRTLLHEAIPLTGTIYRYLTGAYLDNNIKNYAHGMFQSVYDYPYLSSSANHIFDVTVCYAASSSFSGASNIQNAKKINMYTEYAQVLLGFSGSLTDPAKQVFLFENDLTRDMSHGNQMKEVFVVNFSRLLTKDQMKKGTFSMQVSTGSWSNPWLSAGGVGHQGIGHTLSDASASSDGTGVTSTQGGDMGLLYSNYDNTARGVIFYQAGIVVLSGSAFWTGSFTQPSFRYPGPGDWYRIPGGEVQSIGQALTGSSISGACDAVRHRIGNISFNNTTEINSKIYFCRVPHNKYNYSSNPTYLSGSKIRVKNLATDNSVSYITTVGLYGSANELLAVAKLSEPIRKDPTNDVTIRVRLDY